MVKMWKTTWKSLWVNLWESWENFCTVRSSLGFCTIIHQILHKMGRFVESFSGGFAQYFSSVKWVVLHISHIAYYYNY